MLLMRIWRSAPDGTQGEICSISARMAALKLLSYKQEWNRVITPPWYFGTAEFFLFKV